MNEHMMLKDLLDSIESRLISLEGRFDDINSKVISLKAKVLDLENSNEELKSLLRILGDRADNIGAWSLKHFSCEEQSKYDEIPKSAIDLLNAIRKKYGKRPLHPRDIFLDAFLKGISPEEFMSNRFVGMEYMFEVRSLENFIEGINDKTAEELEELTGVSANFWKEAYEKHASWEKLNGY